MAQRYFQWVAGERKGQVVFFDEIVQEDGMTYIAFKDKSRVNLDLVAEINSENLSGKMVAEVENPNNVWRFEEVKKPELDRPRVEQDWESQTKYEVPTADEIAYADGTKENLTTQPIPKKAVKEIKLIPPRKTYTKFGKVATTDDLIGEIKDPITTQPKVEEKAPEKSAVNVSDPVYIMMDKSKKVDTEVNMTLTISLPSSHLFDVVRDSFDDGDKKALEYIIENIDITDIKNALKEGIKAMYGPNEDPEDNKVAVWSDERKMEMPEVIDAGINSLGEPIAIEDPIIEEGKPKGDFIPIADAKHAKELENKE